MPLKKYNNQNSNNNIGIKNLEEKYIQSDRLLDIARFILCIDGEYTALKNCHQIPLGDFQIRQSKTSDRRYLTNVSTCQNKWLCPVCAQNLLSKTYNQINTAMSKWQKYYKQKNYMITFTLTHNKSSNLKSLLTI